MTGPLYRTGTFCARHHWLVIAAWVLVVVALALGSRAAGERNSDNLSLPGTGSTEAQNLLKAKLPQQAYGTNPVVLEAAQGKLTDSANSKAVDATVKALKKEPGVVRAVSPLSDEGKAALSKDGRDRLHLGDSLDEGPSDLTEEDAQNDHRRDESGLGRRPEGRDGRLSRPGGIQAGHREQRGGRPHGGGRDPPVRLRDRDRDAAPDRQRGAGARCVARPDRLLGHLAEVPTVAPTLATMIGLGVGIDYALFIVTRHKLQLNDGMEVRESIARATATAGGAVFFAGGTVVIALVSLLASGIPLRRNDGVRRRRWRWWSRCSPRSRSFRRCSARSACASTPCA